MARTPLFARLSLVLALLPPTLVSAQVEVANIPLIYDNPAHLGQAQGNRVCLSNHDTGNMIVLAPLGGGGASGSIAGIGIAPYMAETTDEFVVMSGMNAIVKRTKAGALVKVVEFNPFLVNVGPVIPLPSGQVMVAHSLSLKTYDGALNEVGSFPTAVRANGSGTVVGLARRMDGVLFTCERTPASTYQLTAYSAGGAVLWDVPIAAGGPIALAGGTIYVALGTGTLQRYAANGAALGPWTGPPGNPLAVIIDLTASVAGDLLFTLTGAAGGPLRIFTVPPVPTVRKSWGEVKAAFR